MTPAKAQSRPRGDGWISVEERLPEVGKMWNGEDFVVLEYEPRHEHDTGRFKVATTMWLSNHMKQPDDYPEGRKPIRWMPLPKPADDPLAGGGRKPMTMKPEWQAWIEDWQSEEPGTMERCSNEKNIACALASLIEHLQEPHPTVGYSVLPIADGEEES